MKEIKTKILMVRVTDKIKSDFYEHCKKYKYIPSQRLRVIIEKELKNEI